MKISKYTEESGLMPREEWTKLIQINSSLLEACKAVANDTTHTIQGNLQAMLSKAISQAESEE